MASDLFGDINPRRPTTRSNRRTVIVVSVVLHGVVFVSALFFSLSTPRLLPSPRTALAFIDPERRIQLLDVQLPAPRPVATPRSSVATPVETLLNRIEPAPSAAPLIAPTGISREVDLPAAATVGRSDLSAIEQGSGGPILAVGRIEHPVAPAPQAPIRLHSGVLEPVKRVNVSPTYPALAQAARVQGTVILEAIVDTMGRVQSVKVLRSIPMLDQAAMDAVRQWLYSPAQLNGAPVPVIITVTVNFKL